MISEDDQLLLKELHLNLVDSMKGSIRYANEGVLIPVEIG